MENKKAKIIVIAGIKRSGSFFMLHAINQFLEQSGHSVSILSQEDIKVEKWNESEKDFLLVKVNDYDMYLDALADLVYTSKRNSMNILSGEKENEMTNKIYGSNELIIALKDQLNQQDHLISWLRSRKHAYNQNYDVKVNSDQLNNFANLNAIVMPIKYIFKDMKFDVVPLEIMKTLDKIDPRYERKMQNIPNPE